MGYFAFGLNHESAPVEVREAFELDGTGLESLYRLVGSLRDTEWLVLSTCNRTEVYGYGPASGVRRIRDGIAAVCADWPRDHAFHLEGREALEHVVQVVTGLRSQVLGDAQILGQTKDAYRSAATAGTLGPGMHRLMHSAFAASKRVITETGLGTHGASVARSALATAAASRSAGDGQAPWRCLLLGAGRMAELVLTEATSRPDVSITLANRTRAHSAALAAKFGVSTAPWDDRHLLASKADVVIAATSAHELVLLENRLPPPPPGAEVLLIDIAVPRDIDPAVSERPGYTLLNIDRLLSESNRESDALVRAVERARVICRETVEGLLDWEVQHDALGPAIQTLYRTFEAVREREVSRNLHRFVDQDRELVDRLTRSIMQKLLSVPVVRLKMMADSELDLAGRIELLNALFDRPECEEVRESP